MSRFYCDLTLAPGLTVALPDAVARHALAARRLRAGSDVVLFNGDGAEYAGVLESVGGRGASVRLVRRLDPVRESSLRVQRSQASPAVHSVRSGFTQRVNVIEGANLDVHGASRGYTSGQLRNQG